MYTYIHRGTRRLTLVALVYVVSLFLPILAFMPSASAAGVTYSWTSQSPGGIQRSDATFFTQVTKDDTGQTLSLSTNEMVLESPRDNNSCSSGQSLVTDTGGANNGNYILTVNGGNAAAVFGNGELIIVNDSLTDLTAKLVQFQHIQCSSTGALGAPDSQSHSSSITLQTTLGAMWTGATTISFLGNTFTDSGVSNGTMTLTGPTFAPNGRPCGPAKISIGTPTDTYISTNVANLSISSTNGNGGACQTSTVQIQMGNQYMTSQTTGEWGSSPDPDATIQITNVGTNDAQGYMKVGDVYGEAQGTGTPAINGTTMTLYRGINTNGTCANNTHEDQIQITPYQTAQTATATVYYPASTAGCASKTLTVAILGTYGVGAPTNGTPTNPITSTNTGCVIPDSDFLSWITCPILTLLKNTASSLNTFIVNALTISTAQYFNPNTEKVFNIFRNISVAMLVIAALLMVVSQAADLEVFAAHTVRKALPRIVIATIAIALAWPLLQFIVGFFNDIGVWLGNIILSIGASAGTQGAGTSNFQTALGGVFDGLLAVIGGVTAFGFLSAGGLLSLFASLVFFIGLGALVLDIRQVLALLCVFFTPVALAAYTLPGTEKIAHFWRETFTAILVMFPVVTSTLAAGAALAAITAAAKIGWYDLLAVGFYIAPYVMLPFIFSIIQGALGQFINWARGTHQQTIEGRLQKFRQNAVAQNAARMQRGTRFTRNGLGNFANNFTAGVSTGIGGGFGIGGRFNRRATAMIGLRRAAGAKQAANDPIMQQLQYDDDGIAAMFASGGRADLDGGSQMAIQRLATHFAETRQVTRTGSRIGAVAVADDYERARRATATAAAAGINADNFNAAASLMMANKARSIASGQLGIDFVNRVLDDATVGNDTLRSQIAGQAGYAARGAGRTDLATIMASQRRGLTSTLADSWERSSMQQLGASTDGALRAFLENSAAVYNDAGAGADARRDAAVQLLEAQNLLPYVSPGAQQVINDHLSAVGWNDAERNTGTSAENFLATNLRIPGIGGDVLRSRARIYDMSTQGRGGPPNP